MIKKLFHYFCQNRFMRIMFSRSQFGPNDNVIVEKVEVLYDIPLIILYLAVYTCNTPPVTSVKLDASLNIQRQW